MNKKKLITIGITLLLLAVGLILNYYADRYIQSNFYNPPLDDLLLRNIPFYDLSDLNEFVLIISWAFFIVFILKHKTYSEIPFYLFIMGAFSIFRALFMIMTPLGSPYPNNLNEFGILHFLPKLGMFPSGHVSVPFMFLLFSYYKGSWRYSILFLVSLILVISTMLISHGHYTIDLIATIFIVYSLYSFSNKHLRRWLVF